MLVLVYSFGLVWFGGVWVLYGRLASVLFWSCGVVFFGVVVYVYIWWRYCSLGFVLRSADKKLAPFESQWYHMDSCIPIPFPNVFICPAVAVFRSRFRIYVRRLLCFNSVSEYISGGCVSMPFRMYDVICQAGAVFRFRFRIYVQRLLYFNSVSEYNYGGCVSIPFRMCAMIHQAVAVFQFRF